MVELDLCLMVGDRGILGALDSVALLLNCVEHAKGVAVRPEGIKVGAVFYLALEFLVTESQDSGENLVQAGVISSLFGHRLLAFGLSPVLGAVQIVGHIFVAWIGRTNKNLLLTVLDSLTCVVAVPEGCVSRKSLGGIFGRG